MQLYRGMDIGTAKLTLAERRGVPHHLLDVWDVTRTASVAEYQVLAAAVIDDIEARGRVPVLVGGSGLYVRAALGDLEFPGTDETIRARLEAELAADGPDGAVPAPADRRPGRGRRDPARERPQDRPRARGDRAVRAPVQRHPARLRLRPPRRPGRRSASTGPSSTGGSRPGSTGCGRPVSSPRCARLAAAACARAGPPPARSATSRCSATLDGEWTARAGPRRDRPGDPPLRPPPGILVQERPAHRVARVRPGPDGPRPGQISRQTELTPCR